MRDASKRSSGRVGDFVGIVLALTGCQPEPGPLANLPDPTPFGDHLRFYTDDDGRALMCQGSLPYMDRYVAELIAIHGVEADHVVDYYWFPTDPERVKEICEVGSACAFEGGVIVTPLLPHEHELVHAVRSAFGTSQSFLEEGAAELWGTDTDMPFDFSLSVESGVDEGQDVIAPPYYGIAGRFSAYLAFEFGTDTLVAIGKLAGERSTPAQVDDAFESVIGMSVSETESAYRESGWGCQRSVYRDDSATCAAARRLDCAQADENGDVTVEFDLDCASEHFVGPREGMIWSDLVIPFPSRAVTLHVAADEASFGITTLRRCDVGCEDPTRPINMVPNQDYKLLGDYEGPQLLRIEILADGEPRGTAVLTVSNACDPPA